MSTLSLNNIAPITLVLTATPQAAPNFSIGLVLTHETAIPSNGRVQEFTNYTDLAAEYTTDTVLKAFAAMYFGQTDFTPASLKVGVKADTDAGYAEAIAACVDEDPAFYGVACVSDVSAANQQIVNGWCQAVGRRFFFCTQEADCLSPAGTPTNMLYAASAVNYARSFGMYSDAASDAGANAHAAAMGFYLTTQYDQPNSLKTALMANFTSVGAATLTQSQFDRICGKTDGSTVGWNGNVYTTFGTSEMLQRGLASDGRFQDEGMALDWLVANMQVDYLNCIRSQRIPATDKGSQILVNAAKNTLNKAVRNGLLAPGYWNFPGFGTLEMGDWVDKGWYSYAQPVSSMTVADRAARKAPAITTALVGAGALQYLAPTIIFQR
jgi:hypothetical protein